MNTDVIAGQLRFDGEVAIITGGGGGLGAAYAKDLASRGAHLVINDLPSTDGALTPAARLVDELREAGADAVLDEHDVIHDSDAIVNRALTEYGRLDIVIANAGISSTPWNSGRQGNGIHQVPPEVFDLVSDTSYKASARIMHHAWPHLAERSGRAIMTSSGSVFGIQQSASYISAKSALIGLTRTLAMDGARDGVRVNAIMPIAWSRLLGNIPGSADFMEQMEARFTAERVAHVVIWLVHADCTITGETISAGGGFAGRVALGVTHGWRDDTGTAEGFAAKADEVVDMSRGIFYPGDAGEDLNFKVGRALGPLSAKIPLMTWPDPAKGSMA